MANLDLHSAKKSKNDEFYTQMKTIEDELRYYKDQFKDKVVFCNCDDPLESNFVKYFALQFQNLGLKKLIATHYVAGTANIQLDLFGSATPVQARTRRKPYVLIYEGDKDGNRNPDISEFEFKELMKDNISPLNGTGDFRSPECIEFLKEADIVVTNPPFSLFREYVAQLVEYDKKFLIIGNQNAITYKETFKLIKDDKMWLGQTLNGRNILFEIPDHYDSYYKIEDGKKFAYPKGVVWFTNLNVPKRNEFVTLYKKYNPEEYPKYDNYDAINVDKAADIPVDYDGFIGVPITFLHKYNPEQFEIIELGNSRDNFTPIKDYINPKKVLLNGETVNGGAINCVLAIKSDERPMSVIYYTSDNVPYLIAPYARIIIKKRS